MRHRIHILVFVLLAAVGVGQIVSTYSAMPVTDDEPRHVAAGMEQLQYGTYTYEYQAPPLARLFFAVGPYLAGARLSGHRDIFEDGNAALASAGGYQRNLTLARLGGLPFFAILCVTVYAWARRWYSPKAGLWAVGLLSLTAPILGHAGVAEIDLPGAAGMTVALYTFLLWLERPNKSRSAWFGAGVAFALATKLSSLWLLPFCLFAGLVIVKPRLTWKAVSLAVLTAFAPVWACYGFSLEPLDPAWGPHPRADEILDAHQWLEPGWHAVTTTPFPLSELVLGIRDMGRHNAPGGEAYSPLALKTPIGLMGLSLAGLALAGWRMRSRRAIAHTKTAVFALTILAVCMTSSADPGALALYPLLAILAASAIAPLRGKRLIVPLVFVGWIAVDALRAHPDYLGHVNEFASVLGNR